MKKRNLKKYVLILSFLSIVFSSGSINAQSDTPKEEMPRFPGCEDKSSKKEKEDCARSKLLEYVYRNLIYPDTARIKGTQGLTVLQFFVTDEGRIGKVTILKDIGDGCGDAVKKVIESMNQMQERWIPGKQLGKNVNAQYILPVKFELQGNDEKPIINNETHHAKPESDRKIFKVVEEMPRFPGCEDKISLSQKEDCAKSKLLDYVYGNLVYPLEAQEKKIEGSVVLQFIIKEDGTIDDIRIVLDIRHGCGEAAKKVVEGMKQLPERWIPAKQGEKNVDYLYTLPVKFSLK